MTFPALSQLRPRVAMALAVVALIAVALGLARPAVPPGEWTLLVATGDQLARVGGSLTLGGHPLTARTAYLLAYHYAQDEGDVEHMLAAADRLEALGEGQLAGHVRRAAASVVTALAAGG